TSFDVAAEDDVRDVLRRLKARGAPKLHWRDESTPRRARIAAEVARMPLTSVVVVRSTPTTLPHDPERARRKCMERLLWELVTRGVPDVTFESRGPRDDDRDRRMLDALRRSRGLPGPIRLNHAVGRTEPLLWAPDAVCGAVVEDRCGETANLATLAAVTTIITC
ncbi:MAG: hypothetical protein ACRCY9_17225, partial [Phycicoccus sp.]